MITDKMLQVAAEQSLSMYVKHLESGYNSETQHVFSIVFEKKMRKLVRKMRHPFFYQAAKRIAAIFLAILIGAGIWLSVDTQARAAFYGWFKGIYGTYFSFRFSSNQVSPAETTYNVPTWIPDEYSLLYEEDTGDRVTIIYASESNGMLSFSCVYRPGETDIFVDAANATLTSTVVGDYTADLLQFSSTGEASVIMWTDEAGRAYVISAYLSDVELEKIANSIYKK